MLKKFAFYARLFSLTLVFSLFLNVACSTFPKNYTDKEFNPYIEEFYSTIQGSCDEGDIFKPRRTSITFASLKGDVLGQCIRSPFYWKIEINKNSWGNLNSIEKRMLLFHELTHCVFKEDHVKNQKNHYMNEILYEIPVDDLFFQFAQIIDKHCGKK